MKDIINLGIDLAKEAGVFLKENFGKINKIESKGDRDFVTNLDKESEKMIVSRLKKTFPNHGIIGEEGEATGDDSGYLWIIDPIDGTHNFMRNINIFGVSLGLLYKQQFVGGIIYMPFDDELYVGEKGNGAYKNGRRIRVSKEDDLKKCSISYDSSIRYAPEVMLKVLGVLADQVFNIRMLGSSVRVLTYVAEGKLDFSVEFHDRPWDFAGGVAIIEEAQGKLTTLKGKPLTYKDIGYIASNSVIHDKVLDLVSNNL